MPCVLKPYRCCLCTHAGRWSHSPTYTQWHQASKAPKAGMLAALGMPSGRTRQGQVTASHVDASNTLQQLTGREGEDRT